MAECWNCLKPAPSNAPCPSCGQLPFSMQSVREPTPERPQPQPATTDPGYAPDPTPEQTKPLFGESNLFGQRVSDSDLLFPPKSPNPSVAGPGQPPTGVRRVHAGIPDATGEPMPPMPPGLPMPPGPGTQLGPTSYGSGGGIPDGRPKAGQPKPAGSRGRAAKKARPIRTADRGRVVIGHIAGTVSLGSVRTTFYGRRALTIAVVIAVLLTAYRLATDPATSQAFTFLLVMAMLILLVLLFLIGRFVPFILGFRRQKAARQTEYDLEVRRFRVTPLGTNRTRSCVMFGHAFGDEMRQGDIVRVLGRTKGREQHLVATRVEILDTPTDQNVTSRVIARKPTPYLLAMWVSRVCWLLTLVVVLAIANTIYGMAHG